MIQPSKTDSGYDELEMYNEFINQIARNVTLSVEEKAVLKTYAEFSPKINPENYKDKLMERMLELKQVMPCFAE